MIQVHLFRKGLEVREMALASWAVGEKQRPRVEEYEGIDAAEVARRVAARPELAKHGSGFLLYVALDQVVDTFFPAGASATPGRWG